jgi:hypothetical protein
MDSAQMLILGGAFVLGAYAAYETHLKDQIQLAQALILAAILYVGSSFMLNIFQAGSTIFMGITLVLMLKTVILGSMCTLIYNSIR